MTKAKEDEFEQKVGAAEQGAIEKYKAELKAKGKKGPSTNEVFRAAFRAGALWWDGVGREATLNGLDTVEPEPADAEK